MCDVAPLVHCSMFMENWWFKIKIISFIAPLQIPSHDSYCSCFPCQSPESCPCLYPSNVERWLLCVYYCVTPDRCVTNQLCLITGSLGLNWSKYGAQWWGGGGMVWWWWYGMVWWVCIYICSDGVGCETNSLKWKHKYRMNMMIHNGKSMII